MSDDTAIQFSVDAGIGVAVMQRPKQRNAFTADFMARFQAIVAQCRTDKSIEALVLTGTDGVFSGGGDIKGMVERNQAGGVPPEDIRQRLYDLNGWLADFRNLEIPVIAAVDGAAYGGGFGLALCADFILASPAARFCSVFCRIGAVPDCGVMYTLPRMIGMQKAKELMYTGRPVDADEAKALGIVMDIHPAQALRQEAVKLATRLQAANPAAFAITKRVANQAFDVDADTVVEMEASGQAVCLSGDYHKDAVQRFVEKRPLRFNWEAF